MEPIERPAPGYRRRILIEPTIGQVTATLEDDYHRMAVALAFAGNAVTGIEGSMDRSPWTTCPGALAQLRTTFLGQPLSALIAREARVRNCTHLFDLATFAAAHAGEALPIAYEIEVADPVEGVSIARLWRNGVLLYDWSYTDQAFVAPETMAATPFAELGRWIGAQPAERQEAARILRWATMIAMGRRLEIVAGSSATRFASGACFTLQPDMAAIARRRPGAEVDFSHGDAAPLADRAALFACEALL
jgi:hypothetical protein